MNATASLMTLVLAVPFAADPSPEPAPTPLTGRWTLDPAKSEDGREKLREAMRGREGGSGRPPRGGPGGGGGPRGGGGGGRPRGGFRGRATDGFPDGLRTLMEAPPGLTITQTAEEITIIEEDGRFRALHPDRKEYKGTGGEKVQTRWEGGRLLVETKGERGPRLVETFDAAGDELRVAARLEGARGQPVEVKRVYRRSAAAE